LGFLCLKYNPKFPFCQRGSTKNGHTAQKLTEQMIYTRGQLCYSYINENVSKKLTQQDIQVGEYLCKRVLRR